MSYIDLINAFWRLHRQKQFSANAVAVFFHLLNINNYHKWAEWFELSYDNMALTLKLDRRKCMRSVRELSLKKAISSENQGGRLPNKYSIKSALQYQNGTTNGLQSVLQTDYKRTTNGTLLKSIENRDIEGERVKPPTNKPRVFMSDLKAKKAILEKRLKALKDAGYEDAWGHQYANKEDRLKARELKQQLKALEDRMLEAV
jgi:hypothetical protein